ncbi:MAG: AAA family ATPase, partial [Treponema sp.]|nr:AAA family ATPase [Treponema sp.]
PFNIASDDFIKDPSNRIDRLKAYLGKETNSSNRIQEIKYTIDVDFYGRNCLSLSRIELNAKRCFFCEENNERLTGLMGKIIYLTFFTEKSKISDFLKYDIEKIFSLKIKEKYMQKINSFSDIDFLTKNISLTENELKLLQYRYRFISFPNFSYLFDSDVLSNPEAVMLEILGISKSEYSQIIRKDKNLVNYGFIEEDGFLSEEFYTVIQNQDLNLYFSEVIKEIDVQDAFDLSSFSVNESKTKIFCNLLNNSEPVSILLYGNPGSGKTEYAKALAKSTGKKVIIFKNESEITGDSNAIYKLNLLLSLDKKDSILIIDEAESVLKTVELSFFGPMPSKKKGLVNKMLDNSKNKVIWIVNRTSQFDDSTKRRFTMSCKFDSMPKDILNNIIISKLQHLCLSDDLEKDILNRFEKYNITGASVDNVVKTISSFSDISEADIKDNVEIVLKENSLLLNGNSKMRETVSSSYDSSVLNTSMDAEKIVKMVKNAQNFAQNNHQEKDSSASVRMLFYGLSGTGKTEFARYLSEILGKKILLKRASDILDKFVGGTEEKIATAFEEAAAKDQILLFDEADSFFADRNKAERSWERTQVNEFLTQMEEFPGILICTTNLKKILDKATLRRFHITVEFNPLQEDGIKTLLQKFFPAYFPNNELEKIDISALTNYNSVTPGDFGRLAGKIRFLDEEDVCAQMIIDELCDIQEEKDSDSSKNKIGFAV